MQQLSGLVTNANTAGSGRSLLGPSAKAPSPSNPVTDKDYLHKPQHLSNLHNSVSAQRKIHATLLHSSGLSVHYCLTSTARGVKDCR